MSTVGELTQRRTGEHVEIAVDDERMLGEWALLATSSGHLDVRPRVLSAEISLFRSAHEHLRFDLTYRTPRREAAVSGRVPLRPVRPGIRTAHRFVLWKALKPFIGRPWIGPSGEVAVVRSTGSMLLEPGLVLLARTEIDRGSAHRTVLRELGELDLTPLQVRELSWRVTVPGTSSSRFVQDGGAGSSTAAARG